MATKQKAPQKAAAKKTRTSQRAVPEPGAAQPGAAKPGAGAATFEGFPEEAFAFLRGLKEHNSKAYFDAHRKIYDECVVPPARAFVVALGRLLQEKVSPAIVAEPKANGSLGRINRDIRFSADKTPYHTHLHFVFWEGASKKTSPGLALWISPDGVGLGVGMMGFDKPALGRWRDQVLDDDSGAALAAAIAAARKAGATVGAPHYKQVPKGFDPGHPRAELLKHTSFHVMLKEPLPKSVSSAAFAGWCADRLVKLAPVHRWLVNHMA